jgi:hypothetical protein
MDDLQALRLELDDLRREVRTLRRTRWITPGSLAAGLISIVALGVAAPKHQQDPPDTSHRPIQMAQELSCKSVRIVDDANHTLLQLGSDKDGGYLVLNGADGKKRSYMAVENNAGFSDWYDADGNRRATVFVGDKGAEFHLADKLSHIGAVLLQGENGGSFAINGPDSNNRVHAGVDNGGGFIDISDALGNLRETFYLSDKNTAQFKIIGADKVPRFLASGEPAGGQITTFGEDGKAAAQFPEKKAP